MSSEIEEHDSRPRRLHPSTLLFSLLGHAKSMIIPLLVVLFLTSEDSWELWFGLLIIPAMIFEAWRYLTYRYRFEHDELIITQGVLFRSERRVPLARIQNIDSTQSFLQRAFGVAEARVETAGGAEAEAELKVLSIEMLEEMRARVFARDARAPQAAGQPAARGPEVLFRVPARDLFLLGLDPGRGLALVGVGLGLAYEFDLFERVHLGASLKRAILASLRAGDLLVVSAWIAGVIFAAIGLVLVLSLAATAVKLYGFRLERSEDGFRVHAGLFTHVASTIRKRRIQFLSVEEPPLLRLFDRAAVKIETAGAREEGDEQAATRQWLLPVVRRDRLAALLREIEPRLDLAAAPWRPLAPGALRRCRKRYVLVAALISVFLVLPFGPWGLASALLLVPLGMVLAREAVHRSAWARTDYGVMFRRGVLHRRVGLTFPGRVQVVALSESPFDRRHRMASLEVDTAGGGKIGHRISIPYLERKVAEALRTDLFAAAERTPLTMG